MNRSDETQFNGLTSKQSIAIDTHVTTNQNGATQKAVLIATSVTLAVGAIAGTTLFAQAHNTGSNSINVATSSIASTPQSLVDLPDQEVVAAAGVAPSLTAEQVVGSQSVNTSIVNGQASVTVNGETVDLPSNGTVTKTVDNGNNGQTNVSISVQNEGSSSASPSATSRVNVRSYSSSNTSTRSNVSSSGGQ